MVDVDAWLTSARTLVSDTEAERRTDWELPLACEALPRRVRQRRVARYAVLCAAAASAVMSLASGVAVAELARAPASTWIAATPPEAPYNILVADVG